MPMLFTRGLVLQIFGQLTAIAGRVRRNERRCQFIARHIRRSLRAGRQNGIEEEIGH